MLHSPALAHSETGTTISVGQIQGGGAVSVVVAEGVPNIDLRESTLARALCAAPHRTQQSLNALLQHSLPLGLLAEEITPDDQRLLGNLPQAYSHVGLTKAQPHLQGAKGKLKAARRQAPPNKTQTLRQVAWEIGLSVLRPNCPLQLTFFSSARK